ncbi:hypothetical protein GQ607_012227 [Colletotrichum asianum]|uniref:Uncharacterized protein n=1 Tax=Colletotrichum asianum TaxID=702518 RepID=A0A8H3ZNQ0_9PEZI|nr:hypothetical protein GQ607_012227 [Colletotrichum asianum]
MTGCNSTPGPLNAAGDIVGYGILAAFFGSALVTIAAVLLAYYHDAIDDDLMTDLDHQFKIEIRSIVREAKEGVERLLRGLIKRVFRQVAELSTARSNTQHRGDLRKRRTACFNQFVLSLSDQQLVTGLALLLITVSSQNDLSGYEFSVAHSLAWFSSTTHLATLDVLRPTLKRQNRYILAIRVLGVLSILVLLTYTSYRVSSNMSESKLPASCTKRQVEVDIIMVYELAQTTLVLLVIWGGYICRLLDIWLNDEFDLWAWASRAQLEKYPEPRPLNLSQRRAKALANRRVTMGGFYYNRSFLSIMPMISFSFSYGV